MVYGSTLKRRAAWQSLSPAQQQQVRDRFQQLANQAAASSPNAATAPIRTRTFAVPDNGATLTLSTSEKVINNVTLGFLDTGNNRVLVPTAVPQQQASSKLPSTIRPSQSAIRLIYAPLGKSTEKPQWQRIGGRFYVDKAGEKPRLVLASYPQEQDASPSLSRICPAWGCHPCQPTIYCPPAVTDTDRDGISDAIEQQVADIFTPAYHVSANEAGGTGFATFQDYTPETVQTTFGSTPPISYFRVVPSQYIEAEADGTYRRYIKIDYLTLWNRDDGLVGDITCPADIGISVATAVGDLSGFISGVVASQLLPGLQGHALDNEHSAVLIAVPVPSPSAAYPTDLTQYEAVEYFTAAHENTFTDHSTHLVPRSPITTRNTQETHIELFLSRSKHSTYVFNPNGYPILPEGIIDATYAAIATASPPFTVYYFNYNPCPYSPGDPSAGVYLNGMWYPVYFYNDGSCDVPEVYVDNTTLALLFLADSVFTDCVGEHFTDQGTSYAATRINVGEPSAPTAGNHFIQDNTADHAGAKLIESPFPDKQL